MRPARAPVNSRAWTRFQGIPVRECAVARRCGSRAALLLAAVALGASLRCSHDPRPINVLLISIDTLRADRLGCYGARDVETPGIDAFAREGVLFRNAYSPLPLTLPSHATMMTGLQPVAHGLVDNGITTPALGGPTLAERLSAAGYDTAAFVAAFVLNRIFGLDRGFALYDDGPAEETELVGMFRSVADARERVDAAIEWLGRPRQRPFFMWLHLFDVHAPHVAPGPFAQRFASRPYDGEVAYVDVQVRRLLEYLKWRGLEGRTLVVLTSDHGESLGEHGEKTHGFFVYDATLRVPLILRLPGRIPAGRTLDGPATLADLAPTILDLLGLPPNPRGHGVALFGPSDAAGRERALWAQSDHPRRQYGWARLRSVRRGTWKYIDAPRPELYDLARDPGETSNLVAASGPRARELADLVARTEAALARDRPEARVREPDADAQGRLAALGYLAGGAPPSDADVLDPGEAIAGMGEIDRATALLALGGPGLGEAEGLFRGLIQRFPRHGSLRISLGRTLELLGRSEEAEAVYREAAERADLRSLALGRLLFLAGRAGKVQEEIADAGRLVESFPRHAASRRLLADALARAGAFAEAETAYRGSLALDPRARSARMRWCRFLIDRGRDAEAEPLLSALAAETRDADVAVLEGARLRGQGRLQEAVAALDAALAERPHDPALLADRGLARLDAGEHSGAIGDLEAAVAGWPGCFAAWDGLARLRLRGPAVYRSLPRAIEAAERAAGPGRSGDPRFRATLADARAALRRGS